MINFLKNNLIGKRFIKSNGDTSPIIKSVKMKNIIIPDSPENDWWGYQYQEMTIYFDGIWGNSDEIPFKDCLSFQIEGEIAF